MRERQLNSKQVQVSSWPSVEKFLDASAIPEGYLVVQDDGVPLDLYYKSRGSDTTVVCFHGAVQHEVRVPWLVGAGVLRNAEANRLSISDPNLHLYLEARNTWFIGSEQTPNLQDRLEALIRHVACTTGTKHLIFFGGSSGGFAALAMSHRFEGSLALPMNPQTNLARHHGMVDRYLQLAWPNSPMLDNLPDRVVTDLVAAYGSGYKNTVGYIQNERDRFHIRAHQEPFFEHVDNSGSLFELRGSWGKDGDNGHITPPRDVTAKILAEVSASGGRWDEALEVLGFAPPA